MGRIAVIGAGVAGLTAARLLSDDGHIVTIFEKARGVGGRISTRRTDWGGLDHGAQYFTIRDPRFETFIKPYIADGVVEEWQGKLALLNANGIQEDKHQHPHYVGVGGMNKLAKAILGDIELHVSTRVTSLKSRGGEWHIACEDGEPAGPFERVVIAIPPAQAADLIEEHNEALSEELRAVNMEPCISVMLRMKKPHRFPYDGIRCDHPVLGWVANQHSKPEGGEAGLIIHSSHAWAAEHINEDPEVLLPKLLEAASEAFHMSFGEAYYQACHRWLYATPEGGYEKPFIILKEEKIAFCGDWCQAGRVEGAFLSAYSLVETMD